MKSSSSAVEERLEDKYAPAIALARQVGIELTDVHTETGRLLIRGKAPGRDAKEKVLKQLRKIDRDGDDVVVEISVRPGANAGSAGLRYYTVRAGDTLAKIARQFYGSASEYRRIFDANVEKVTNPNKIQAGEVLMIPEE